LAVPSSQRLGKQKSGAAWMEHTAPDAAGSEDRDFDISPKA
jgi:hypothetical protein